MDGSGRHINITPHPTHPPTHPPYPTCNVFSTVLLAPPTNPGFPSPSPLIEVIKRPANKDTESCASPRPLLWKKRDTPPSSPLSTSGFGREGVGGWVGDWVGIGRPTKEALAL